MKRPCLIKGGWGDRYRIFEPQWKQVILLWLGREDVGDDQKEEFIQKLVEFDSGCQGFYELKAFFLAAAGINEFKACSLASEIVRQVVKLGIGEFDIENQKWITFLDPIKEGARETIPETIRQRAIYELINILEDYPEENVPCEAAETLGQIDPGNPEAIAALVQLIATTQDELTRVWRARSLGKIDPGSPTAIATLIKVIETTQDEDLLGWVALILRYIGVGNPIAIAALVKIIEITEDEFTHQRAAESLGEIGQGNPNAIATLVKLIATTKDEFTRIKVADSLGKIDPGNPNAIATLVKLIETTQDEFTRIKAAFSLRKIPQGYPEAIAALVKLIATTQHDSTRRKAIMSLGEIGVANLQAIAALVKLIATTESEDEVIEETRWLAAESLQRILTTPEHYIGVVSALKDCLSDEVYQNNFNRFHQSYRVIWNCAENLPYPEFYQAWHHPVQMPHPEVEDNTPVGNATVKSREILLAYLRSQLQNRPIYCLNAYILANETDSSEIALTLCQLIWEEAFPDEAYPQEVTTPSKLREHLQELKLRQNLPKLAILIDRLPCDQVIEFCQKLTNIVAIAFLTDDPLEAPLKGFPPNQPNLLSAIETWLEEI
ncbi:HEAT repeat domain-containing protein [Limnoraphis robusta]|uniref:HEAT repeat domain-containing protein n=1 Tax=Limnoraphis robusta CCNP1315 TaxID=3110306 RepID=A0ABU5U7Z7_9CYAN|nr:HEAT repeat domain-containing protein [Limnoraphis robusta]MEA5523294.1 HEAT repeat domain-containing protein [Limnoraphis robusta CCNP1315]MEA5547297.1 HEAT repeat domain-containing protein [Limnoraphis robusta CCNP1324]